MFKIVWSDGNSEDGPTEGFFRRAFSVVVCGVRGLKTLLTCFALLVGGVLDQYDFVDLLRYAREFAGDNVRLGSILIALAVVFFVLRMVTKGPIGSATPRAKRGLDEGE